MRAMMRAKGSGSLPGKHTPVATGFVRIFPGDDRRLRRGWFVVGSVLAVVVVWSLVWAEHDTAQDPRPLLWQPPAPAAVISVPPPSAAPSPTTVRSAAAVLVTPSLVTAHSSPASVTPSPTSTSTSAGPTSVPAVLRATYTAGASSDTGFVGGVTVTNGSGTPQSWTVTVRYDRSAGVRITQAWNATPTREDDAYVFRGGPLAPGATVDFGFEATKRTRGPIRPAACTVNQTACRMS
jgi:hypothetical protein